MLSSLLCLQLAAAGAPPPSRDSVYASVALREMISAAAVANREPPPEFRGYRARVETELSLIIRDTLGRERAAQVEQLAANAKWERMGEYDLHVVGYRSQSVGVPYSALSIVRGWTVPSLYGDRLLLGAAFGRARSRGARDQLNTVHPFASDREQYYRFTGGDTVTVLRAGGRAIPIARIHVVPHLDGTTEFGLFDGEIDLDASRHQIVRMRGQFVVVGPAQSGRAVLARIPGIVAVAYAEFVNAEVDGRYWLPTFQRTEFQASVSLLGQTRSVFRLVSRFGDFSVDSGGAPGIRDSTQQSRMVVTYAPTDSTSHFGDWRAGLGVATSSVTADDFDDIGPDSWKPDGPPRLDLVPVRTSEMLRFNRVEGLYTGVSGTVQFRSLVPGLSAGVFGGWAWTEATPRGGVRASMRRLPWIASARAERSLASTNDFAAPLEDGSGIGALLGTLDDFDYVDRTTAVASLSRALGGVDVALATLQIGVGRDRAERARLVRGLLQGNARFRPNRGSMDGDYASAALELELHPNVTGDFVQPGIGGRIRYEAAGGQIAWQRVEVALSARKYWGPVTLATHVDGGIVMATSPPPQQLFELGGSETLPGYEYKEFAGDRAALFRTFVSYRFPVWRSPVRVARFYVPGLGPGVAVGAQGGWSELSSVGAHRAVDLMGFGWSDGPVSRPTDGLRATVGGGLTLFSDILHIGVARPVDRSAPWRFVIGVGQSF